MADQYLLRITAGPSYDPQTHTVVPVNGPIPISISSEHCTVSLKVRVQNYNGMLPPVARPKSYPAARRQLTVPGLPRGSPTTSAYFSAAPHTQDRYSIAFSFVPGEAVAGPDLVFGNDFDRPIRDRLPPGFGTAFKIVKWAIDPGLEGDVYADEPYLYGPLLSSINVLAVGPVAEKKKTTAVGGYEIPPEMHEDGIDEGGDAAVRHEAGMPDGAAERKKWGLVEANLQEWVWEAGRAYGADFFNPYLDFNEFALRLPGFSLSVLGHMDGRDSLR
jgi:hypothetical protein